MALFATIKDEAERYIAKAVIAVMCALAAVPAFYGEDILPPSFLPLVEWTTIARLLVGLTMMVIILAIWIVIIRWPKGRAENLPFDPVEGVYFDSANGLRYCARCKTQPLRVFQDRGWKCDLCGVTYFSKEFRAAQMLAREQATNEERARLDEEDRIVQQLNNRSVHD